ncbi:MAG TPA: hypothetical protein VGK27_07280 [Candidatus Deferrimicrobiaceae bacterium]|jgi:hypothetical protein
MKRFSIAALLFLLLPAAPGLAGEFPRDDQQVYLFLAGQGWKDFSLVDGSAVTDDKGYAGGIGWEGQFEGDGYRGYWRPRLQGYMGRSNYKEKTVSGDIDSKSSLSGMSAELDYLYRIPVTQSFALEPVLGMAIRMDRRVIGAGSAGSTADNTFILRGRYREERRGFMARIGLRGTIGELGGPGDERTLDEFSARHLYVEGGLLVPAYMEYQGGINQNRIRTKYYPGAYFEASGRIGRWQPAVYYETIKYDYTGAKQAQSDVLGFRLGMRF